MVLRPIAAIVLCSAVIGGSHRAAGQQARGVPSRPREPAESSRQVGLPDFRYRGSDGCGQLFLYSWNDERTEVLRIELDMKTVFGPPPAGKSTWEGAKRFDLADAPKTLRVAVDLHPSPVYSLYCTAVPIGADRRAIWRAVAGTLTVDVGENTGTEAAPSFPVTAVLQNGVFEASDGRRIRPVFDLVIKTVAGREVSR